MALPPTKTVIEKNITHTWELTDAAVETIIRERLGIPADSHVEFYWDTGDGYINCVTISQKISTVEKK
jgi:hypothetical protein